MSDNYPNQATVYIEGNPVKRVSLLTGDSTPQTAPKVINGSEREQIMLCDPLTGLALDLQNGGSGNGVWGQITGSLPDQSDLNTALLDRISIPGQYTFNASTGLATDGTSTVELAAATVPSIGGTAFYAVKVAVGGSVALASGFTTCRAGDMLYLGPDGAGGVVWNRAAGPGLNNTGALQMSDGQNGFEDAVVGVNYSGPALLQSGVPMIYPPAGTFAANGVVNFTSGLVSAPNPAGYYSGGAYWLIPANAIDGANPQGWFWGVANSQSQVTIYNNIYTPSSSSTLVKPATPQTLVPFVSSSQSAYTPVTSAGAFVPAIIVPLGGTVAPVGPNGKIIEFIKSMNSTAAVNKSIVTRLGAIGSTTNMGMNSSATVNTLNTDKVTITNNNGGFVSANTQSDTFHGGSSQNGTAIDLTVVQYLSIGGTIASGNTNEWLALTWVDVDVRYSA